MVGCIFVWACKSCRNPEPGPNWSSNHKYVMLCYVMLSLLMYSKNFNWFFAILLHIDEKVLLSICFSSLNPQVACSSAYSRSRFLHICPHMHVINYFSTTLHYRIIDVKDRYAPIYLPQPCMHHFFELIF